MTHTSPGAPPRLWRSSPAEAAKANGDRRRARAARKKIVDHLTSRGLVKTAKIVWTSPPSMLPAFMDALDISADILDGQPMPGTGPKPAPADLAIATARTEIAEHQARAKVADHLTSLGLMDTAAIIAAASPAILTEFIIEFDVSPTILGETPLPAPAAGLSAGIAVRTAWKEVARMRATDVLEPQTGMPAAAVAAAQDSAHRAKGRQALINTRRAAPPRPPARPVTVEPPARPRTSDPEAARRLAAALAKAAAAAPKPEAKPNCSGSNLEVITKWEEQAETVFAAEGSVAQCRAANAEAQMLCTGCPMLEMCARQAKDTHYTGVAGGRIFIYGRPRLTPSTADRIVA